MNKAAVLKNLDRVKTRATPNGLRYYVDGLPCTAPVNSLLVAGIIVRTFDGGLMLRPPKTPILSGELAV